MTVYPLSYKGCILPRKVISHSGFGVDRLPNIPSPSFALLRAFTLQGVDGSRIIHIYSLPYFGWLPAHVQLSSRNRDVIHKDFLDFLHVDTVSVGKLFRASNHDNVKEPQ